VTCPAASGSASPPPAPSTATPPVLICDEPASSALDPLAEEAVYRRIQALAAGRTVILITHRLGSTPTAGRVLGLDGGHLIEEGTHESLAPPVVRRWGEGHVTYRYPPLHGRQPAPYSGPVA
jgi:ABC-type glutathione transport system ATPase component